MAPAALTPISDEKRQLERQMGCMAGFLQLFDRHQRIYSPRRLHSPGSTSPSERSELSAVFPSSPENSPEETPVLDSWKLREAPRLSLDSRLRPREHRQIPPPASGPEAGKSRRPPSVVARLMGVDALPELRRSVSESRASRDPYRSVDRIVFQKPPDLVVESRSNPPPPPPRSAAARRSFFDAHDFFPDPNKLRSRGIDEPAKDLETLKLILEASQLKGLLRSRSIQNNNNVKTSRNPPIVVLKPDPKPARRSEPGKGIRNPNQRVRSPPPPTPSPKKASSNVRSARNQRSTADVSPKEIRIRSPPPKLLERCDELLRSIAAFTSLEQQQPSPVSVLDSSFLGEESSASPSAKRSIWEEEEEERWSSPPAAAVGFDVSESDARDFGYVCDILRLSDRSDGVDEVRSLLEKRHGATDASESAALHRRLMFDAVAAILVRRRHISAWEAFSTRRTTAFGGGGEQLIREVWLEVRRTREGVAAAADDLDEVTCGAIRKDMGGGDHGWGDTSAETSDAIVLNIERLMFKELVEETIRGLADVASGKSVKPFRRKLVF